MATPSAQYSLRLRIEMERGPGSLGRVATAIGATGGAIGSIEVIEAGQAKAVRDVIVDCTGPDAAAEIVETVKAIAPGFGGINLEDISSPRCFEIEERLVGELNIPVFHDDQHGTAIVVLAALINACKLTGRRIEDLSATMVGAGAAGIAA